MIRRPPSSLALARKLALAAILSFALMPQVAQAQETRVFKDDLGREVTIPVHPQRIVSMHDLDVTIPLIELGVTPVASHGRIRPDGSKFLRSSAALTGVDFNTSDIAYLGSTEMDIEAVVAAKPDLIITEPSRSIPLEQLERIAPTVYINNQVGSAPHIYSILADLTGTQERLKVMNNRYAAQIAMLKRIVDTENTTVSVIQSNKGKMVVHHTYRALGRVLRDAGFKFPALIDSIPEGDRIYVSAERLPELDADYVFATFREIDGDVPKDEYDAMEELLPGFCNFLQACRDGQYIILPREEAISNSFAGLSLMVSLVQSHMSGRFPPVHD